MVSAANLERGFGAGLCHHLIGHVTRLVGQSRFCPSKEKLFDDKVNKTIAHCPSCRITMLMLF